MAANIGTMLSHSIEELRHYRLPKFFDEMTKEVDQAMGRDKYSISDNQHAYNVYRCARATISAIEGNKTIDKTSGAYLIADRSFMSLLGLFKDIGIFNDAVVHIERMDCRGAKKVSNYLMKALRDWSKNVMNIDMKKAASRTTVPPKMPMPAPPMRMNPAAAAFKPADPIGLAFERQPSPPKSPMPIQTTAALPVPVQTVPLSALRPAPFPVAPIVARVSPPGVAPVGVIPAQVRMKAAFFGTLLALKKEAPDRLIMDPSPMMPDAPGMKTIAIKQMNGMYCVMMLAEVESLEGIVD